MDKDVAIRQLSQEAQYDLSCACGTNDQDRRHRDANGMWVYPASLPNGGKSVILKTLLTSSCSNDCRYCPLRSDRDTRRYTVAPDDLARYFMDYARGKGVFGLFLTSGVLGTADRTMERMTAVAELLRYRYEFRGFLHLKILPGSSHAAIEKALSLASAVSLNVEAPTAGVFADLSGTKDYMRDIVEPMQTISRLTSPGSKFARVKQTTQFIVGAGRENDGQLIEASQRLYRRWKLQRIYFSAYQRGLGDPALPAEQVPDLAGHDLLRREHRLYQVDYLLRKYRFSAEDIPLDNAGNLSLSVDPKQAWADAHPERFPVRLRRADRDELLRVPGLGPVSVGRLLACRKNGGRPALVDAGLKGKRLATALRYVVDE